MEEEAEKLKQLQSEVDKQMKLHSPSAGGKFLMCFVYFSNHIDGSSVVTLY
jgi:hypothetical protein